MSTTEISTQKNRFHPKLSTQSDNNNIGFDLPEDVALLGCVLYMGATSMPALMKIAASVSGFSG